MPYHYIGQATTNANGIATLSYTGAMKGIVNLKAVKTGNWNVISSEYKLTDCIYIDNNTNWKSSYCTQTIDDTGTLLAAPSDDYALFSFTETTSLATAIPLHKGECFEFTPLLCQGVVRVRLDDNELNTPVELFNSSNSNYLSNSQAIQLVYSDNEVSIHLEYNRVPVQSIPIDSSMNRRLVFRLENGARFKFKGLKCYPYER